MPSPSTRTVPPRRTPRRARPWRTLVAGLALGLAGCGPDEISGDASDAAAPISASTPASAAPAPEAPSPAAPAEPRPPLDPPRNVVLVSIDNLGAAHVGAYGYERDTTPFLDELAAGGVVFEEAVAQATWTLPSHSSMLSSRFVSGHGVWNPERRFPSQPALLPEELRAAGFATAAFTSCLFVSELYGLDRGFDLMVTEEVPARKLSKRVLAHLRELGDEPFFLFLHFYDVHQPFDEPNPYGEDFAAGIPESETVDARRLMDMVGRRAKDISEEEIAWIEGIFPQFAIRAGIEDAASRDEVLDDRIMMYVYMYLADKGSAALEARKGRYDNGIANMDQQLAELFEAFRAFPWYEDTLFVLTSDHGESFNEPAGVIGHGGAPYREQALVPLIAVGAGARPGLRVSQRVASIDIAPTILDLLDVPVPPGFQGQSLARALDTGNVRGRPMLTGSIASGIAGVRAEGWTLLVTRHGDEMKLVEDRLGDVADVSAIQSGKIEVLRKWLDRVESANARLAGDLDELAADLDEDDRRRLRELGYLK